MPGERVYDTPTHAVAESGVVILDGPDGLAISLTPAAARASAAAMIAAADAAEAQDAPTGDQAP